MGYMRHKRHFWGLCRGGVIRGISPCEKGALVALGGGLFAVGNRPGAFGYQPWGWPSAVRLAAFSWRRLALSGDEAGGYYPHISKLRKARVG